MSKIIDVDKCYVPVWNFTVHLRTFCEFDRGKDPVDIKMSSRVSDNKNRGRLTVVCPICRKRVVLPCDLDIMAFKLDINNVEYFYEKLNQFGGHYIQPLIETITLRKGNSL